MGGCMKSLWLIYEKQTESVIRNALMVNTCLYKTISFTKFTNETMHCKLTGKNACPPEDCNGPEGYESLLIALKDPKHEDHKDMKEWLDDSGYKKFNPKKFSVSKAVISD